MEMNPYRPHKINLLIRNNCLAGRNSISHIFITKLCMHKILVSLRNGHFKSMSNIFLKFTNEVEQAILWNRKINFMRGEDSFAEK